MPEVEITRKQVIVVGEIKGIVGEQYPKWVFTDKEGKEYKVNPNRSQFFQDVAPGKAVEISFSKFHNTEYPYNAVAVADAIPTQTPDAQFDKLGREQKTKGDVPKSDMTKADWEAKDKITRKSIERQKSLEMAIEQAKLTGEADPKSIIGIAKQFEAYLEGNKLMEAAKELGAEEIPF